MRKNAALVAIVVVLGFVLSYVSTMIPVGGKIALAVLFTFAAMTLALTTRED
jgi:uncharacterized membrane protein